MTRLYDVAAKCSGCLALVCALLAVLATPSSARADELTDCQNCCAQTYTWGSIEWNECVSQCMQGTGPCVTPANCPNSTGCNNGCITQTCFTAGCANTTGCTCSNNSYDPNCSSNCACKKVGQSATACECTNK